MTTFSCCFPLFASLHQPNLNKERAKKKIMGFQVMLAQATRFRAPENATAVYDSVSPPNVADEHKPGESKKDENDGMEQHQSLLSFSY